MEKTDSTEYKLQEPINFTDPYVLHDVKMKKPTIVHLYKSTDIATDNVEDIGNNDEYATIKVHGVLYPLIQLNTKVLDYNQIKEMVIYYDHFLPTIKLTIIDPGELIKRTDIPGYNNTLKVIIVPEVDNVYKSIALEFKIMTVQTEGEYLTYYGKYKILEFNKKRIKELTYQGCSNQKGKLDSQKINSSETIKCNTSENKQPNTWELLHIIANECQLGFSSTDECQNIEDRLPRLIYNKNYEDFIEDQMIFSGLDENSIFDTWVDLYGYLVLVNVAWVLNNENITSNNLGIYAFTGVNGTDTSNEPEQDAVLVHRTLTNFTKSGTQNNLAFLRFNTIVNNSNLMFGTSVSMYNFELLDINNGNNSINQYDIEVIRDSVDDQKIEDYEVQYQEKLVIECNNIPINKQKLIRQKFFSKHRQRILEVELLKLNLGLQRGTLVNIVIFESNERNKQFVLSQSSNIFEDKPIDNPSESDIIPNDFDDPDNKVSEIIMGEQYEIPNLALSGIYYIDSMRFEYNSEQGEIKQYLQLIKKSNLNNLSNLTTPVKINTTIGK